MSAWQITKISDVCQTSSGGTPLRSRKEFFEGGTIPWLLSGEVSQREITQSENFITPAGLANSSAKIFPPNTVLVAMYGATAGKVGLLKFEATTNQAVCGILPSPRFVPEYLYYVFLWKERELAGQAIGNAQPNISQAKIRETVIPIPPLAEQQRIVAMLDEAFEGVAKATANAERNLANARELFSASLHARISGASAGAPTRTLVEISRQFGRGKSKHRPRNDPALYGGPYPFIQTGEVRNASHYITSHTQTYNEVGLRQSKLWPAGTICITIAANIAETGVLTFDACFPDSVIGIVVDERLANAEYVEFLLQFFQVQLKAQGKGSAQENINLGTFESARFPIPDLGVQREIVEVLNLIDGQTQSLQSIYEARLKTLGDLRAALLAKAFSGELTGKGAIAA